ncbi:MAG: Xaa-Pro dipeptidase [Thermococcaceae archaeon]|nr:Xaa-Pro dipeptidase [Thermococcaceae archaeon]
MERKIFEKRINRFQELLKREDIDGAVIRTLSTFVYFTGTKWLRPALLIPQDGEPTAIVAKGKPSSSNRGAGLRTSWSFKRPKTSWRR